MEESCNHSTPLYVLTGLKQHILPKFNTYL